MTHTDSAMAEHTAPTDVRSYGLIFGVSFLVFLGVAVLGQLLGWHWRSWLPGAEGVKSIFGGVKAAVYTFMSHLQ